MKRSLALGFLSALICLAIILTYKYPTKPMTEQAFTNNTSKQNDTNTLQDIDTKKTFVITELGCPSKKSYSEKQLNSRVPWDMAVFNGKLFLGCGDYDQNTGPCDIWQLDLTANEWSVSDMVDDEAVMNFEIIDQNLIATGTDPKGSWTNGSFYTLISDGWQTDRTVPFAIHMFDIAKFNGKTFYAIGNQSNAQSPIQITSDGITYTNAPFYIDGVALIDNPDYGFSRCYNLFESDSDLFAFCWFNDSNNQPKMVGIFKFDGQAFHYVSTLTDLGAINRGNNRQLPLNKAITYDNKFFFSTGYLYSTDSFESLNKINIPNDPYVQDMTVNEGNLYILTSTKNGEDAFLNTIWEYTQAHGLKEIYSFPLEQSAITLEKYNDAYFVGIGQMTDLTTAPTDGDSPPLLNGYILKLELK